MNLAGDQQDDAVRVSVHDLCLGSFARRSSQINRTGQAAVEGELHVVVVSHDAQSCLQDKTSHLRHGFEEHVTGRDLFHNAKTPAVRRGVRVHHAWSSCSASKLRGVEANKERENRSWFWTDFPCGTLRVNLQASDCNFQKPSYVAFENERSHESSGCPESGPGIAAAAIPFPRCSLSSSRSFQPWLCTLIPLLTPIFAALSFSTLDGSCVHRAGTSIISVNLRSLWCTETRALGPLPKVAGCVLTVLFCRCPRCYLLNLLWYNICRNSELIIRQSSEIAFQTH